MFPPKARAAGRDLAREIRDRLGNALYLLQQGERPGMPLSRSMPSVATGVCELRLHCDDGQFRAVYFTLSAHAILIPHAFVKKTPKTPALEIDLARKRFKELIHEMEGDGK